MHTSAPVFNIQYSNSLRTGIDLLWCCECLLEQRLYPIPQCIAQVKQGWAPSKILMTAGECIKSHCTDHTLGNLQRNEKGLETEKCPCCKKVK